MDSRTPSNTDIPVEEATDEGLIARYNRGELAALDQLVERYRRPLHSFIWRMTGGGVDTDGIFQDTWVRVIMKSADFRQDRFKGWIFRIAHNLVIDWSRKQKKQVSLDAPLAAGDEGDLTLGHTLESGDPTPDRRADATETGRAIQRAVKRLPAEQREVFTLRMEASLTFKEIAEVQKVSINTALSRMQYALASLRKTLQDYAPESERP